ncbi:MAG TPA: methylthioribulose 1-phosphate dehydratase [Terriglobia bacterium]|nr:methylthioribulose 1-phosphate dehydratase [Terriglobia bacterium]
MSFSELAGQLAAAGKGFYERGWVLGTSGNFSAVAGREPLRVAITESAAAKGSLTPDQILEIDGDGAVLRPAGARPSAETLLHLAIYRNRTAGAVLHTHSIHGTMMSDRAAADGGFVIHGYEMLKGLAGIDTHEHREWIPVLENSQNMRELAAEVETLLAEKPSLRAFLIRRHGLYTWGRDLAEATRHVEILEFLMEVLWRSSESRMSNAPFTAPGR